MYYFLPAVAYIGKVSNTFRQCHTMVLAQYRSFFAILLCTLFCVNGIAFYHSTAFASQEEFRGTGEIIVIYPASETVIIDIVNGGKSRIVGGKVAVDATLMKGDQRTDLSNFQVGSLVNVVWRVTDTGKEILALIAVEKIQTTQLPRLPVPKKVSPPVQISEDSAVDAFSLYINRPSVVQPLIGIPRNHRVVASETLLDIARKYDLGFNELTDLYPEFDPWLPPVGTLLILPTERLLPDTARAGIVVNIAEMRLYHYSSNSSSPIVNSYPVSIGDPEFQTPEGKYTIANKAINPTWYIPPSLKPKYNRNSIPPGPDNPLGKYWLGIKNTMFGIHGTDIAWSIGRTVTHGCIRMYPEDIQKFFPDISVGTSVQLVYQPVKIAKVGQRVFIEVHRDIYGIIGDINSHTHQKLQVMKLTPYINENTLTTAIAASNGMPIDITADHAAIANTTSLQVQGNQQQ
jgi:L,D-transpeptidase ErfK/SrfK